LTYPPCPASFRFALEKYTRNGKPEDVLDPHDAAVYVRE
jgi:hypothetical protein